MVDGVSRIGRWVEGMLVEVGSIVVLIRKGSWVVVGSIGLVLHLIINCLILRHEYWQSDDQDIDWAVSSSRPGK